MSRKHRVRDWPNLEKTPMIDVVFLLLIFFVFSFQQEDILAQLPVARPMAAERIDIQPALLEIRVFRGEGDVRYAMNGHPMTEESLRDRVQRLADFNADMSVVIKCTADSSHSSLIRVLDVCAEAELTDLSVFSM